MTHYSNLFSSVQVLACTCAVALSFPGNYKHPDGYFMYLNVPRQKEYESGFNMGNEKHHISRFEQVKDHRFRTRVNIVALLIIYTHFVTCVINV